MYIEPNTTIRLLKNCPLDTTYEHTLWFGVKSAQTGYFRGLTKFVLSEQSYQRVNKGRMRVQYKADDIYDCNYLMFQNSNYGSKWFYAFIKSVEYVNNITSEIEFEIDVMQTWFFDYTLEECFVEREHVASDKIGEHTIPENLEFGEYMEENPSRTGLLDEMSIVVAATFNKDYEDTGNTLYSGIFSGLTLTTFDNTTEGAAAANEFIRGAGAKTDGIVSVSMMAKKMVTSGSSGAPTSLFFTKPKLKRLDRIDGKPIRNNKLYTYPYNFLYVTNLQGSNSVLRYEFFSSDVCDFSLIGDMSPTPSVMLMPLNYNGAGVAADEQLSLTGYPQLPFAVDSYRAWMAQFSTQAGVGAAGTVAGAAILNAIPGVNVVADVAFIATALYKAVNSAKQVAAHSVAPDAAHGSASPSILAASKQLDFLFINKHIRPEYVSIIDDFFTMFGYARNRVKVPNRRVRENWTYTKTANCVITGSVPCDDAQKICNIYNNGVTFWVNGNNVGNYSLSNDPVIKPV